MVPCPESGAWRRDGGRSAPLSPANAFLASLSRADAALILPSLTPTSWSCGETLGADAAGPNLYFPLTLVANIGLGKAEWGGGLIGREGVIGWAAILGGEQADQRATVLLDGGTALALPVAEMRRACLASQTLSLSLLRFVQSYLVQLSATIRAHGSTTLRQRLSALLLMLHDRIDGDEMCITHQALSLHLHVRRASVTDILHLLEGERVLRCDRRSIRVRDREQLEASAGDAYGTAEEAYRRSIGPFGKAAVGLADDRNIMRAAPPQPACLTA